MNAQPDFDEIERADNRREDIAKELERLANVYRNRTIGTLDDLRQQMRGRLNELIAVPKPVVAPTAWDGELAKALADVRAYVGTEKQKKAREPLFGDVVELLTRQFDGARWLVNGLITVGGVAAIGGAPKSAKSWLAFEVARAVATGMPACGEFYAAAGVVALFCAEDLAVQVRNRVRALCEGVGRRIEPGRFHVQPRGEFIDVLVDEDLAWIVASCRRLGHVDLLVLDPLRDVHSGEEDKSDSMRDVMRRLRLLAELLSCTVLIVHHSSKMSAADSRRGGGQRLRGSSAIHGSLDAGIFFDGEPDGDGTNTFINVIESMVKGARSAGTRELTLNIEDDEHGEAIVASWTVEKAEPRRQRRKADDERLVALKAKLVAFTANAAEGFKNKTELVDEFGTERNNAFKILNAELARPDGDLYYVCGRIYGRSRS